MFIAQFGAGADDSPAKPFIKDLQRWTGCEENFSQVFLSCNHLCIHILQGFTEHWLCTQNGVRFWLGIQTNQMQKLLPSGSLDLTGSGGRGKASMHAVAQARPRRRLEVKDLLEAFSSMNDDRWGICGLGNGSDVGWGRSGGPLPETENTGGEAGWRQKEKTTSNLLYLGHLCRNKGPEEGFSSSALLD